MNFIKFESRDLDFYKNHLTSLRAPGDYLELYKVQNFIKFSTQYRPTSTGHPGSVNQRHNPYLYAPAEKLSWQEAVDTAYMQKMRSRWARQTAEIDFAASPALLPVAPSA